MEMIKYCRKCKEFYEFDVEFCPECGGKTEDVPDVERRSYIHVSSLVYGPPYSAKYVCEKCGKTEIISGLGSPRARFCKKCGAKCKVYAD